MGDEVVLLDSPNGHYCSLDRVGRRMLDLALSESDATNVSKKLLVRFEAPDKQLSGDFDVLMGRLRSVGLVEPHGQCSRQID